MKSILIFGFYLIFGFWQLSKLQAQSFLPDNQIKTVVIDAGHGGRDPGAVGKKSYEKTINLKIALQLGRLIKKNYPKIKVIYTRQTDKFVGLWRRTYIAQKYKADLFISIHTNAARNRYAYGTETFVFGKRGTSSEVIRRENRRLSKEQKKDDFIQTSENQLLSLNFAHSIEKEFIKQKRHSRGVKRGGLYVLRLARMPAVLIEVGFISNHYEEKYMRNQAGQTLIAQAIFRGFKAYKKQTESTGYRIQLAVLSKKNMLLKTGKKAIQNLQIQKLGKVYKHFAIGYKTKSAAQKALVYFRKNGFPDAFLVFGR